MSTHARMHACTRPRMLACVHACMRTHVRASESACVRAYVCVCLCKYVTECEADIKTHGISTQALVISASEYCVHVWSRSPHFNNGDVAINSSLRCVCVYVRACVRPCVRASVRACACACMCVYVQVCKLVCEYACTHARMHACTQESGCTKDLCSANSYIVPYIDECLGS